MDAVSRMLLFCDVVEVLFGDRVWVKLRISRMLFLRYSCQLTASLPNFKLDPVREVLSVFMLIA